ncbi:hypothetical protein JQ617_03255 [Bradyrhizobium sp. KB893862 SZCCT0404]|uniref:hypothetical protein n=1 Tax=Bradyrhizobium sp. KB893862 SZCCT0404 TaxID=2807672 RepID=UPI001BAE2C63|nr:hypothetical protein [Bradyrhizobium sp. KB893862 SZCCT0404]MBR1172962.1 hypothetical protein [Bradyrhizobium sp. KB893862 SZCCT0404]
MRDHLLSEITNDLLFGVVFGKINASDVRSFSNHGGLVGLKYAALHWIDREGIHHGPTFEERVGVRGSSLREVLTMLRGVGLTAFPMRSIETAPSLKGRFLLDFSRKLLFEWKYRKTWSEEFKIVAGHLKIDLPIHGADLDVPEDKLDIAVELLQSIQHAKSQFGVDLLGDVSKESPVFYSSFDWKRFMFHNRSTGLWESDDDLPFPK